MEDTELFEEPIVERAVVFEFECADRVGDFFDGVFEAVRPVVHWVDAPFVAGSRMRGVEDAIHDGVAHVEVWVGHVDFCT